MACLSCGRGFHDECILSNQYGSCCCKSDNIIQRSIKTPDQNTESRIQTREVTESAGRKRAAKEYEIDLLASCEWQGLANCGGGLYPIIGCIPGDGFQKHRHHGPVKNTTRNERENIHLICAGCHVLWHRRNDEHYSESLYETLPHRPREATPSEMLQRGAA